MASLYECMYHVNKYKHEMMKTRPINEKTWNFVWYENIHHMDPTRPYAFALALTSQKTKIFVMFSSFT